MGGSSSDALREVDDRQDDEDEDENSAYAVTHEVLLLRLRRPRWSPSGRVIPPTRPFKQRDAHGDHRARHIGRFNTWPVVHSDIMSNSNIDEAKGRAKEAAGALTDNDDLKREGKADQAGAKVKERRRQGGRQGG